MKKNKHLNFYNNIINGLTAAVLIVFCFIFLFNSSAAGREDSSVLHSAAREYYQGNFEAVIEKLEPYSEKEILSRDQFNVVKYLAMAQSKLSNLERAEELIDKLNNADYRAAELHWLMGKKYFEQAETAESDAKFEEALTHLRLAKELGLGGLEIKKDLAHTYAGLERYNEALQKIEPVIEAEPEKADYSVLAEAYRHTGELRKARDIYERLIVLKPGDAKTHRVLGDIYRKLEEPEEAAEVYRLGINANPDSFILNLSLLRAKFDKEDFAAAEERAQEILETHPDSHEVYHLLGRIYKRTGNTGKATEKYRRALKYNRGFFPSYFALNEIYRQDMISEIIASRYGSMVDIHYWKAESLYQHARNFHDLELLDLAFLNVMKALIHNPEHESALKLNNKLYNLLIREVL